MFRRLKETLGRRASLPDGETGTKRRPERETTYFAGAYRLHDAADVAHFTALAVDAFPAFDGRISCFAADWLGRQFATDTQRVVDGEPQVLLLEPGTGEVLQIPASFTSFHEEELAQQADAAVAYPFFQEWIAGGGTAPGYDQCVGYRKPLFLGGRDDVSNLELSDFDVYWSICGQLLAQVRDLPPGTRIGGVSISDG